MYRRKRNSGGFKAQVALEAIRNDRTIAEIASEYGVRPCQVNKWKKQVLDRVSTIFSGNHDRSKQDGEKLQAELSTDQSVKGGTGLAEKRSRLPRLRRNVFW